METKNKLNESERERLVLLSLLEDQKETLDKLKESEELFRALAESTATAIFIYQGEKFLYVNEATARITGYSKEELLQMNFWDVVHPDFKELVKQRGLARQRGETIPNSYEIKLMKKDGTIAWVDLSAGKISWAGKEAAIGSAFDITERKAAEKIIEYERNLNRTILNLLPAAIWVKDKEGRKIFVNKAELELSGKNSEDEVIGKTDFELYNETDALKFTEEDKFVIEKGEPLLNLEGKITKPDGNDIYLLGAKVPLRNSKNEIIGIVGVNNDITERKLNELQNIEKQKRTELQQKILIETATSAFIQSGDIENLSKEITEKTSKAFDIERVSVWIFSKDEKFLECVDLFEKTKNIHSSGYLLDENQFKNEFDALKSSKYVDANDPLTDSRTLGYRTNYLIPLNITSMLDGVINYSGKNYGTLCLEHVNKQHTWTEDEINFVSQLADQVAICLANKDRKLAEEKLEQTYNLLRLMSDTMTDMLWAKDLEGRYLFANKAICEKLLNAKDTDEPIGKTDLFFAQRERNAHPENPEWHTFGELCADSDKVTIEEMKPMQFDEFGNVKGKFLYLDVRKAPLFDNSGRLIGTVGSGRDITEQKRLHELLKEHEERLRLITNSTLDIICLKDAEGRWLMANDSDLELFQLQNVDYFGKTDAELADYTNEIYKNAFLNCMETDNKCWLAQKPVQGIEIIPLTDGSERIYDIIKIPIFYPDGRRKGLLVNGRDITELIKKQRELLKLQRAIEQSPVSIVITDIDGNIKYVNPKFTEVSGYTFEEAIGKNSKFLKSGKTDSSVYVELWNTILSGEDWRGEFINTKKNGEIYFEEAIISPIKNEEGVITNFVAVKEDITVKKKLLDELTKSEIQFRSIWENSIDAMRLIDEDGIIIDVNDAFCKMFLLTKEELIGKPFTVCYLSDEKDAVKSFKEKYISNTIPKKIETEAILHNKKKMWIDVSNSKVEIDGNPPLLLSIFRDITDKKKMIEELIKAKDKAEEMNRIKSHFFATMSHELRTPFVGIMGFAELLADEVENPQHKEMAYRILQSSKRLTTTLNQILDMTKLEFEQAEINITNFDAIQIVDEVYLQFEKTAKSKNIDLRRNFKIESLFVNTDERLFSEILINLVNNAIKYTEKGWIEIFAERKFVNNKDSLVVKVKDTGIGIPKEKQEIIWQEFRQASEGLSRRFEGTGLGLSIVRRFAELIKAKVYLEESSPNGSTFVVELPIDSQTENETETTQQKVIVIEDVDMQEEKTKKEEMVAKKKILYVEDDAIATEVVVRTLSRQFEIDCVTNSKDALDIVKERNYDLILMDINLGRDESDGIELTQKIRQLEFYKNIPIVALTAYAREEDRDEFLSKGMDYYLSKPFSISDLKKLMEEIFKK
jgi:PAS domain S-box-containing protein